MIRASDFLNKYYKTLSMGGKIPKSDSKTLKTVKTPPKSPRQN